MNGSVPHIVLAGTAYLFRFTCNDTCDYWKFSLYNAQNEPIVLGIKIVPRSPLNVFYGVTKLPDSVFGVMTKLERIGRNDFVNGNAQFVFCPLKLKNNTMSCGMSAGQSNGRSPFLGRDSPMPSPQYTVLELDIDCFRTCLYHPDRIGNELKSVGKLENSRIFSAPLFVLRTVQRTFQRTVRYITVTVNVTVIYIFKIYIIHGIYAFAAISILLFSASIEKAKPSFNLPFNAPMFGSANISSLPLKNWIAV